MSTATSTERRTRRELKTVRVMLDLHCRAHHGGGRELCTDCRALWEYAQQRIDRCRFRPDKPTCRDCPVHCFKPTMREEIRQAMRYAGPRMLWRHPILALLHLLDGSRTPRL